MSKRAEELLPVPYFHVVFTLPRILGRLALQNKWVVYDILFRAAAETLLQIAADPKHLGADIGFFGVLHTWGQKLEAHPHVHFVCPGGGISPDGSRWIRCKKPKKSKKDFFLPVAVLSQVFRGKFIDHLKKAFRAGKLGFYGELERFGSPAGFERMLDTAVASKWVCHAKRPFLSPVHVLKYLARYTHRVAISNARLIEIRDGRVWFRCKNYRAGGTQEVTNLDGVEFMRRFLLHVLPNGFMKIRHYGFLANRHRREKLDLCRELLGVKQDPQQALSTDSDKTPEGFAIPEALDCCPVCKKGQMVPVKDHRPQLPSFTKGSPFCPVGAFDTS